MPKTEKIEENGKIYEVITDYFGLKYWYLNGVRHRENGPAIEYSDGGKEWWLNGKSHREDGPASEFANGEKRWYLNGKLHRINGPAFEYSDGTKEYWLNGNQYSEEEYNNIQLSKKLKVDFEFVKKVRTIEL